MAAVAGAAGAEVRAVRRRRHRRARRPARARRHGTCISEIAGTSGKNTMARALGLGGLFFKSPDPERLLAWYAKWLGIGDGKSSVEFAANALPARGFTVWSPFPANTDYFTPSKREFMFN